MLSIEYSTNIFTQQYLWSLSIHSYSSVFSSPAHYSNRKSSDAGLIYLHSINYGVCLFTVIVRYSVGQFVIQNVKVINIRLRYLYSIIYGICAFTVTVRYSVNELGIHIEEVMNIGLIKLHCIILGVCLFTFTVRYSAG